MNNDLNEHQLESLLRGLAPAAASPTLARRVDEELKLDMSWLNTGSGSSRRKPQKVPTWLTSAGWAAMGAAAAIAVMGHLPESQSTQQLAAAPAPAPVALPASTTISEWNEASMKDSDMRYSRTRSAKPHMLVVSRELQTWVDPRYSGQTSMDIPSQNNLVPVSFQ